MKKTKIIEILKTFDKKEMREFEKFLNSSFFTKGLKVSPEKLLKLFQIFKTNYPGFNSVNFTKGNIFGILYGDREYNDEIIRNLISALTKLAEEFLTYSAFRMDKFENKKFLLEALINKKLDKFYEEHKRAAERILEMRKKNDSLYYNIFRLKVLELEFHVQRGIMLSHESHQEILDSFIHYFLTKALNIYSFLIDEEWFSKKKFKLVLFNEITKHLKENPYPQLPLIAIYHTILMLFYRQKEKYYKKLKELRDKYVNELDKNILIEIHSCLSNYINSINTKGDLNNLKEHFKLDKDFIKQNLADTMDYFPYQYFVTIVKNSTYNKEYEWTEKFINDYKDRLDPKHKSFVLNISYARLFFANGNYNKSLECLSKINIEYTYDKQQIKNLMLKIYYETSSFDSALSLIDSTKHFLSREKNIFENIMSRNIIFVNCVDKLIKLKLSNQDYKNNVHYVRNLGKYHQLEKEIKNSNLVYEKNWLLEKIKELEKKVEIS